jgi:hypothetical protein
MPAHPPITHLVGWAGPFTDGDSELMAGTKYICIRRWAGPLVNVHNWWVVRPIYEW